MIAEATKLCPAGGRGRGCGSHLPLSHFSKNLSRPEGFQTYCKECMARLNRFYRSVNPAKYSEHSKRYWRKRPARRLFSAARNRAAQSGRKFSLTYDWFEQKILLGTCELTGIPFRYDKGSLWRPSPDKIDSSGDYSCDNTRMILWGLNRLKGNCHEDVFQEFVRDIALAFNEQARTH